MNDQDVARGLISTLLGLEIIELIQQPHEFTDYRADMPLPEPGQSGHVRLFRIDFAAVVKTKTGETQKVLIELQKAAVDGVVERFRYYLGKHYAMTPATPIVAIYLLGYILNRALPPVTLVRRQYIDGIDHRPVDPAVRDIFIENLSHDGVVVQLPKVNELVGQSELEQALRIFDQRHQSPDSRHFLMLSDAEIEAAPRWLQRMIRVLQSAASDPEVRAQMDVEDEAQKAAEKLSKYAELERRLAKVEEDKRSAEAREDSERREKEKERRDKEIAQTELEAIKRKLRDLGHDT
jgi:hypothetical protein